MPKFIGSYEIDYVHRVSVGIEAENATSAKQALKELFTDGTIWDDTAAMPLLEDDFHENDLGHPLEFTVEPVDDFPFPGTSVREIHRDRAARAAAQILGRILAVQGIQERLTDTVIEEAQTAFAAFVDNA